MTNFSTSLSQRLSLAQYSASTFFTYSQTDRNHSAVMVLNPSSAIFRRITHLSKSSTVMVIGCTFRVAGGNILSGTGVRAAVVESRNEARNCFFMIVLGAQMCMLLGVYKLKSHLSWNSFRVLFHKKKIKKNIFFHWDSNLGS